MIILKLLFQTNYLKVVKVLKIVIFSYLPNSIATIARKYFPRKTYHEKTYLNRCSRSFSFATRTSFHVFSNNDFVLPAEIYIKR